LRAIRVDDELWQAAQVKADAEGRTVSEVIRELLERWVKRPARQR
jgi:antitoxin component of RelBE/YafQ-DinJ toxin-antitoxin module